MNKAENHPEGIQNTAHNHNAPAHDLKPHPQSTPGNGITDIPPTEETINAICDNLTAGLSLRLSGFGAGVSEAQVQRWMELDPSLEVRFGAAEGVFVAGCIQLIYSARDRHGRANLRAIMWLMERQYPDQFGKQQAFRKAKPSKESAPKTPPAPTGPVTITRVPLPNEPCPLCNSGKKYDRCCGIDGEGPFAPKFDDTSERLAAKREYAAALERAKPILAY